MRIKLHLFILLILAPSLFLVGLITLIPGIFVSDRIVRSQLNEYWISQEAITKITIEHDLETLQNIVDLIGAKNNLVEPIKNKDNQAQQAILSQAFEVNLAGAIDQLLLVSADRKNYLAASFDLYDNNQSYAAILKQMPFSGFKFISATQGVQPVYLGAYSVEITTSDFGRVIGYLVGIYRFNNNITLLNKLSNHTSIQQINFHFKEHLLAGESFDNKIDNENKLHSFLIKPFNLDSHLEVRFKSEHSPIDELQMQMIRIVYVSSLIGFLLIVIITFFTNKTIKYYIDRSINYINELTSKEPDYEYLSKIEFKETLIKEFNDITSILLNNLLELAMSEDSHKAILNNSGSVVYVKDTQGRFQFVNSEFCKLAKADYDDLQGKSDIDFSSPSQSEHIKRNDEFVIESNQVANFEESYFNDNSRTYLATKFPLHHASGDLIGICSFLSDITYLKNTEQALTTESLAVKKANDELDKLNSELEQRVLTRTKQLQKTQMDLAQIEKLASLGSLVSGIAHELNTPLGVAITSISILNQTTDDISVKFKQNDLIKSELNENLQVCRDSGRLIEENLSRLVELFNRFRQLSKDQHSESRDYFKLNDTLAIATANIRPSLNIDPKEKFDLILETGAEIEMDSYPDVLDQILNALVLNAKIHGYKGESKGKITIQSKLEQKSVEIRVIDNGIGIEDKFIARVFDPFFSTTMGQGSNGLGLHIVHSLVVNVLGGTITANSTNGCIFCLTLPINAPFIE